MWLMPCLRAFSSRAPTTATSMGAPRSSSLVISRSRACCTRCSASASSGSGTPAARALCNAFPATCKSSLSGSFPSAALPSTTLRSFTAFTARLSSYPPPPPPPPPTTTSSPKRTLGPLRLLGGRPPAYAAAPAPAPGTAARRPSFVPGLLPPRLCRPLALDPATAWLGIPERPAAKWSNAPASPTGMTMSVTATRVLKPLSRCAITSPCFDRRPPNRPSPPVAIMWCCSAGESAPRAAACARSALPCVCGRTVKLS
mmetsp:Transcript_8417/g.29513  ORF Transcript_8417/g.29513 Transcript_8417/m.29513 type:complete len:257 (-) Transcript_8417:196-966(-)